MNAYPSWIHRIPEMLEALELMVADRLARQAIEQLFDLRKTAAFHLLRSQSADKTRARGQLIKDRAGAARKLLERQT
jgi:hypothetical protein